MSDTGLSRRRFLGCLSASAVLATAGCLGEGSGGPAYADWLPATTDGFFFAYMDVGFTEETDEEDVFLPFVLSGSDEEGRPVEVRTEELANSEDPLLALPLGTGGSILAGAALAYWTSGLGYLIELEESPSAEAMMLVDGVAVLTGSFDTDRVGEHLREGGERPFTTPYERAGDTGEFTLYEPAPEDETDRPPATVAVSGDRILVADDRAEIDRVLGAADGETDRAVEELAEFDWLVETAGKGHVVAGWYGSVEREDLFGGGDADRSQELFTPGTDDVVTSMSLNPGDDELAVELAARSDSLPRDRRERLEDRIGTASQDRSVSVEDGRLSASGTYGDVPFEPVENEPEELPAGDDLPPEIAEAVPPDAIAFSRDTDEEGAVRVEVVKEFQAEELRIRTVNANAEIRIDDPREDSWFTVFPDPDGDEIQVIVTVDGVSGIVATEEFP